jgi:ABC-type transport system substrate-binding protein
MGEQSTTLELQRRREIFTEVQNILAENAPVLYFASPRLYYAHSRRMRGVVPSILRPPVLWNADSFSIAGAR